MDYELIRLVFGCNQSIPLTKDEYQEIQTARAALSIVLRTEKRLAMVAENYVTFESHLLTLTTRQDNLV